MKCEPLYIETTCPICHEAHTVMVYSDDFYAWKHGKNAQDAFGYLSAEEREMLISGICPSCWDEMMPVDDEEDLEEWISEEEDEEEEEPDYEEELYDLEMGFDPYMGCYTEDC